MQGDRKSTTLEVKTSVAAGASKGFHNWRDREVVVTGTFTATLKVEGSVDDATWLELWSVTAPGTYELPDGPLFIRINTTAYTSGTPVATAVGWQG